MKVLAACEFSGVVRDTFLKRGHEAYSCDILPGNHKNHIQDDILKILFDDWDLVIACPPCTHLAVSGARHFEEKRKDGRQQEGIDFFLQFTKLTCKWCIENPVGIMSTVYRKPDQLIQPWQFGHGECKRTCLWLHKLPLLKPTNIVEGREQRIWKMSPSKDRGHLRSIFYSGIAEAMSLQWG